MDIAELDLIWADFDASGDPAPVRRIIDVLERPDVVREGLEAYLASPPRGWIRRWLRRRALRKLEARGVYLTGDRRGIASAQDLDCHCSTDRWDRSEEVWEGYRKLLPFLPERPSTEVVLKTAARRSLARNAAQHGGVLEVCAEEAERRVGRVRVALLEIVAFTKAGSGELGGAVQALQASLDPDPGARAEVERRLASVLSFPVRPVESTRFSARGAAATLTAGADWTEKARSYCSKLVLREAGGAGDPGDGASASWNLIAIRPDTYRVRRLAGSDEDEWITSARHHFRGPGFAPLVAAETKGAKEHAETRWLLVDKYLPVLRQADPVALEERSAGDRAYHVAEYGPDVLASVLQRAGGGATPTASGAGGPGVLRIWLDAETKRLVRAEWEVDGRDGASRAEPSRVVQVFAAYDEAPEVVPPPFQLLDGDSG